MFDTGFQKSKPPKYRNAKCRASRALTIIRLIVCKVCELDAPHTRIIALKKYAIDREDGSRTDRLTMDAYDWHPEALPQRELVYQGARNKRDDTKEQPFAIPSRRNDFKGGGAMYLKVSDNKHGESHDVAILFDADLNVTGVRKNDLMGNCFRPRVGQLADELGEILNFDRQVWEVSDASQNKKG